MDNIYARWFSGNISDIHLFRRISIIFCCFTHFLFVNFLGFTIIVCLVLVGRKLVRCNSIIFDTIMHCEKDTTADGLLMGICDDAYGENLPDFTKLGLGKVQVNYLTYLFSGLST